MAVATGWQTEGTAADQRWLRLEAAIGAGLDHGPTKASQAHAAVVRLDTEVKPDAAVQVSLRRVAWALARLWAKSLSQAQERMSATLTVSQGDRL